jgi:hypothetical protein
MRSFPTRIYPPRFNKIKHLFVFLFLASSGVLCGQYNFEQKSNPGGLFSTSSQNYNTGTSVVTRSITTQYNDFIFTHWTLNNVRQNDAKGQALHTVNFDITENTVAIAHYLDKDQDSDSDGIPDWIEVKDTGNLTATAETDADGDGIALRDEVRLGLNPSIDDNISEGGISIRRSTRVLVNFGGAKKLTLKSDPIGLVTSSTSLLENNSSFQTDSLNGLSNGYYFSHWEVNGIRYSDNKGVGLPQVSQSINEDKVIVAKYIHEDQDSDNDHVPDWYESHYLGGLSQNQSSDSDGDGFTLADELKLGLSSVIDDSISEGGISVRRSAKVFVNLGGASKVTIQSTPPGLVSSSLTYPEINSTYTTPALSGLNNGYYFSHWEVNGVRQSDTTGIGLSQVTKKLTNDKKFIAKFYPEDEDLDRDGIPDWFEWHEQGNLDLNGSSDTDGDGFTLAEENKLGLSSVIFDQIIEGSLSARRSKTHSYVRDPNDPTDSDGDGLTDSQEIQLGTNTKKIDTDGDGFSDPVELSDGTNPILATSFRNVAPNRIFSQSPLNVKENQPINTFVGNILGYDPNDPFATDNYVFMMVDGNGDVDNERFKLESNGSLYALEVFDYETLVQGQNDANFSIRVRVSDSENLSFEDSLPVFVVNEVEDFDADGIEDFIDDDDDNDGISDLDEVAFGSNPFDPNDAYTVPIIRTLGSTLHAIDSLLLKGEVPEDQVSKVSEVGFLLSPKIFFDNPQIVTLNTIPETGNIELSINPQMYPNGIYFRLFAKNPAGTGLGAIKRFRPNTNQSINKWWNNSETSEEGWQRSDWFGNFLPYENGWMYHLHMGWLFSSAEESDSIWLWDNYHKWLWTSKEVFPFLYRWEDSSWLFAYFHKNGSVHYFNYASDSYE